MTAGGDKSRLGIPLSEETKAKIGAANKGRKPKGYVRTEEHRKQLSERMQGNDKGVKITPELAAKWNAVHTPEWRKERSLKAHAARRAKKEARHFASR